MKEMKSSVKAFLLLFFSFTFANSVCVALHETGHALAIISSGIGDVSLNIHPYLASSVRWTATPELMGYVDAAGPLFNIIASGVVFLALYRIRRPVLLPILLMFPVAMFQEGLNSMMQVFMGLSGTDSMNIIASGVSRYVVLFFSIVLFTAGILLFVSLFEMFGIRKEHPFLKTSLIVFSATGLNMVIIILFSLLQRPEEIQRGAILLASMLIFSLIFAAIKKTRFSDAISIHSSSDISISNRTVLATFLIALIPVTIFVFLF